MRFWLLLLLLAPTAAAQGEFDFSTDYHARIAVGDVPLTDNVEPAGINVVEYLAFTHDGNSTTLTVPAAEARGCTCTAFSSQDGTITVGNNVEAGDYVFWIRNTQPEATTFSADLLWLAGNEASAQINIYAPAGKEVTSNVAMSQLPGVGGDWTIYTATGSSNSPLNGFWFTVHPQVETVAPVVQEDGFGYLELVLGLIAGIVLWFWLVQKGFVQARTRKQVVAKAAHTEVAATESKETLNARKRVLMAGLKELELAKMKSEVDDATYDRLKAELKKEAVTTMRALESAQ